MRAKAYFNDKAMLNTKESWKVLNQLSGRKREKNEITLLENGIQITDNVLVANIFQHYFMSIVGTSEVFPNNYLTLGDRVSYTFSFDFVSSSDITIILKMLDIGKATGIDDISPFILSQTSDDIAKHLEILINQMFSHGVYPSKLKETVVHPIYKKESRL